MVLPTLDASADTGLLSEAVVAPGIVKQTHAYGTAGDKQSLDVWTSVTEPDVARTQRPAVVFVHGGSWAIGDKSEWADHALRVAERGWVAVSINYRLSGDAPWPAQRDDASDALAYLQRNAALLGIDPHRIGALGDSAGGHLASLMGVARPGQAPVRGVVTLSGVNDLPGLLEQPSSGGCTGPSCSLSGLALRVSRDLMRCLPTTCAEDYRQASPGALVSATSPATLSFNSEAELIDPRQAWVMDNALRRHGRASRVHVLAGSLHARGYQDAAFEPAMRFLAAALTPESAPAYPRPHVVTTLDLPSSLSAVRGTPIRFRGVVRPRAYGSSVALQVRGGDGVWRTQRAVPLQRGKHDTYYDTTWTPTRAGKTVWRAVWIGGGGQGTSKTVSVFTR